MVVCVRCRHRSVGHRYTSPARMTTTVLSTCYWRSTTILSLRTAPSRPPSPRHSASKLDSALCSCADIRRSANASARTRYGWMVTSGLNGPPLNADSRWHDHAVFGLSKRSVMPRLHLIHYSPGTRCIHLYPDTCCSSGILVSGCIWCKRGFRG